MQSNRRYLAKLTWLRGLAATLVVVSHSIRLTEGTYGGDSSQISKHFFWYFDLGTFGVILFFALSGATLYFSNKNINGINGHLRFYVKRFMRIWPTFAIALLAYVAFIPFFREFYIAPQGNWIEPQFLSNWNMVDFFQYMSLTSNIWGGSELFNNAFWSLPIEFQYYLIFPLIMLSMRFTNIIGPIVIAVLLFATQKFSWIELNDQRFFTLAYSFCFGVVLAATYDKTNFRINNTLAIILFIASMSVCSLAENGLITFGNIPFISNMYGWNGVFALLCLASLLFANKDMDAKAKIIKPFYYLGEISYSLYLYHNLIIAILLLVILQFDSLVLLKSPLFIFCLVLPISIPIASLSFKYIETNSIKLGAYFIKRTKLKTKHC